jgi:hypothetical protein
MAVRTTLIRTLVPRPISEPSASTRRLEPAPAPDGPSMGPPDVFMRPLPVVPFSVNTAIQNTLNQTRAQAEALERANAMPAPLLSEQDQALLDARFNLDNHASDILVDRTPAPPPPLPGAFMNLFPNARQIGEMNDRANAARFPDLGPSAPGVATITPYGTVLDGDYIQLTANAWHGIVVKHDFNSVTGVKCQGRESPPQTTQDNEYTFQIRRVEFNPDLKAFVVPTYTPGHGVPMQRDHLFILIASRNSKTLCTRNPGPLGNNGDYQCTLGDFPLITQNSINSNNVAELAKRMISLGFWNNEHTCVDFLQQALHVWQFHVFGNAQDNMVRYGDQFNIRNTWTFYKAQEASIFASGSPLAYTIQATFNGGRNLTMAAGSNGSVVKLALSNDDHDDKAVWTLEAWAGTRYPIPRMFDPNHVVRGQQETSTVPGTVWDPLTRTFRATGIEVATQNNQNLRSWISRILRSILGFSWDDFSLLQKAALIAVLVALFILTFEGGMAYLLHQI